MLIKGAQHGNAATGHQARDRDREKETKRETTNARWGKKEHIDRKVDLGNIHSTARNPMCLCQSNVLGKCEHISNILITLSLFGKVILKNDSTGHHSVLIGYQPCCQQVLLQRRCRQGYKDALHILNMTQDIIGLDLVYCFHGPFVMYVDSKRSV